MKPQVRALRDAAAQACQSRRFSFREFMEDWGLEDVLNEAEANNWPPKEIAAQALAWCCVTGGKFNNFQVGLLAVLTFLNDQFGPLGQGSSQAFQDLVKVLNNPGTLPAIREWLNSHYPLFLPEPALSNRRSRPMIKVFLGLQSIFLAVMTSLLSSHSLASRSRITN
jgi:hypothetical protein